MNEGPVGTPPSGRDGPRNGWEFVLAFVLLAVVAYVLKGRDRGLPFWQMLLGALVFAAVAVLIRTVYERVTRR